MALRAELNLQTLSGTSSSTGYPLPLGQSIIDAEKRSQKAFAQALQSIEAVKKSSSSAREADDARIIELEKALKLSEERRIATEAACKSKVDAAEVQNQSLKEEIALYQSRVKTLEGTLDTVKKDTQVIAEMIEKSPQAWERHLYRSKFYSQSHFSCHDMELLSYKVALYYQKTSSLLKDQHGGTN